MFSSISFKHFIFVVLIIIFSFSLIGCNNDKDQFLEALVSSDWETAQAILDKSPEYVHLHIKSGGTLRVENIMVRYAD